MKHEHKQQFSFVIYSIHVNSIQVQFQTRKYDEEDRICYEKFIPLLRATLHIFCNLFPIHILPKFTCFLLMMSYWYANEKKKERRKLQLVVYLSFAQIIDKTWKGKAKVYRILRDVEIVKHNDIVFYATGRNK